MITLRKCCHGCGRIAPSGDYCDDCYADQCLIGPDGNCRYATPLDKYREYCLSCSRHAGGSIDECDECQECGADLNEVGLGTYDEMRIIAMERKYDL